jgi:zinc protease
MWGPCLCDAVGEGIAMNRVLPTLSLALLAACATEPPPPPAPPPLPPPAPVAVKEEPRVTPDAPFRQHAPAAGPEVTFVPPDIQSFSLKNGVRVLFTERHELPIVSVRVVMKAGAGDLPAEPPGVGSFVGLMLEQGTTTKSALQISDAYEAIGAAHSAWVDWDSGGASVKVTSDKLDPALGLLSDVLLHPSFPEAEIDRAKARRVGALAQEKNNVGAMGGNAVAASLYGRAHPYGHSAMGGPLDVARLTRAELARSYAAIFAPSRATVLVAGDVTQSSLKSALDTAFGAWRAASGAVVFPKPPAAAHDETRVVWVDKPGAPQSVVRLAEVGVSRSAPDYDAILVMNAILGGMFSSRINLNLREAHAFTYGASSSFHMHHGPGSFSAGGNMVADKTAPAIAELVKEVKAMRDQPVSEVELANAKEHLKLEMPGRFETVGELTSALSDIAVYGLPLDEYKTRPARIDKVTADDVMKAARAHLHPSTMKIIVVGDRKKLEPTLETLHLGPIEELDAYGDPVAPLKVQ